MTIRNMIGILGIVYGFILGAAVTALMYFGDALMSIEETLK